MALSSDDRAPHDEDLSTWMAIRTRGPSLMGTSNDISVFLLEDHELVRASIAQMLDAEPDISVVGQSATATDALRVVTSTRPDVALLDVRLQDGSGIDVCRSLQASHPDTRCLMVTSFSDDRAIVDAALAGAYGMVVKRIRDNNIVRSVRDVAAGQHLLDDQTIWSSIRRLGTTEQRVIAQLSEPETRLFEMIGHDLSNTEIAEIAQTSNVSFSDVRVEIAELLHKLGLIHRFQANTTLTRSNDQNRQTNETQLDGAPDVPDWREGQPGG